ncbi:MAG: hypothetical protein IIB67_06765 [Proteobacteria bacterium]|nr:hypothetical protein [Pseudomonadota bacterium]
MGLLDLGVLNLHIGAMTDDRQSSKIRNGGLIRGTLKGVVVIGSIFTVSIFPGGEATVLSGDLKTRITNTMLADLAMLSPPGLNHKTERHEFAVGSTAVAEMITPQSIG